MTQVSWHYILADSIRTNSAVEENPSFRMADARWVSTVFMLRFNVALVILLGCPSTTSLTTHCSRAVKVPTSSVELL